MQPTITKPNIKSANPLEFLREVKAELKKVVWPTREQTIRLTIVVIGVSIGVGLFIGTLDFIFTKLTEIVLKR